MAAISAPRGSVSHGFDRLGLIDYPASAGERRRGASRRRSRPAPRTSNRTRTATRSGPRRTICTRSPGRSKTALGEPESVKLAWRPQTPVEVGEDDAGQLLKLIDALEDDDDVQTVWGNYEVSDEVMEKLG